LNRALARIALQRNAQAGISVVVLGRKIGNNSVARQNILIRPRDDSMSTEALPPRESMEFDVVIVGAGPSGLAAAIRLKQLNADLTVVVVEKGSEVGAHILSGAVIDPVSLDKLVPDWRDDADCPLKTKVKDDRFYWMSAGGAIRLPNIFMPPLMSNHHCYIGSLGSVCRWLGQKAEALGVEIYPGFAAAEVLYDDNGAVRGIATGDMGVARDGSHKASFTRGMELNGKYTLFAEGARGSLSKQLIARFALDKTSEPAKFGIGLKEVWQIDPAKHTKGLIQHSFGWPLNNSTGGGSFLYHYDDNLVAVGFVVHLNYDDPYLSPFDEFQRFKTHPAIRTLFEGGKRLAYGARAITEGGYQSVPRLSFAGGALVGCAAGFVNVPRIKGVHNAMGSGMLAAEHAVAALGAGRANDELVDYENAWRDSAVGKDLHRVRNVKPLWSKFGTVVGVALGGIDMWCNTLGFSLFGTLKHAKPDRKTLDPAKAHAPIAAPKPDGKLTFDKLSSVFLSNTNHEEDQPVHLKVADMNLQKTSEHDVYAGPSNRYCPAGVYEWVEETAGPRFQINAQNCVHCKTCDVKDPNGNITWVPPEGGGGPNYEAM
jgi:electron-transferring-flavoprotein dehydrogenase